MKTFEIGEPVVFYPVKEREDDNRHFRAEVKGITPNGRYRVELVTGERKTVSAHRLE